MASSMSAIDQGIGLFGGTFDPVHTGHLAVACEALATLHLQRVDFVPAPAPWQKSPVTSLEFRLKLLREAIVGEPRIGINLCDALREGATYTIDTVREVRSEVGPSVPLVLIIGADQWMNFNTWREWQTLTDFVSIAVCNRENQRPVTTGDVYAWARDKRIEANLVTSRPCGFVTEFAIPPHRATSSVIRSVLSTKPLPEALAELETWLPARVSQEIARHRLYSTDL